MNKGKILVVDDEAYILQILEFSLGAEGFEVVTATNGEIAVEKAVQGQPDLIVLDVMMPVLDGYETCRRLKRQAETKNIPVILLTAKGREADKRLGFEVGAADYIVKPFSPSRLISRIEEIIGCRK
jgi:two-component system alkaline phosphatase synthesis response regulator PhoP